MKEIFITFVTDNPLITISIVAILFLLLVYSTILVTIIYIRLIKDKKMVEEQVNDEQTVQEETKIVSDSAQLIENEQQNNLNNEPLRFIIDIPKSVDNGEDAPPLIKDLKPSTTEDLQESSSVLLGVFDGMGGAGSKKITIDDKGTQKTNAYIGSRTTRQLIDDFFNNLRSSGDNIEQQLKEYIQNGLKEKSNYLEKAYPQPASKLVSSLHKKLPTTMALAWYHFADKSKTIQLTTLWAGDSRCYALSPQKGLLQLTMDDNGIEDALVALRESPQMTNNISASQDFRINRRDYVINIPTMIFTASDGVFDYLYTPILLEYNILNTLMLSNSVSEWGDRLRAILDEWKQDDVSMALDLPGFKNFEEVKDAFSCRYKWLKSNYEAMTQKAEECSTILLKVKALNEQIAMANKAIQDLNLDQLIGELKEESDSTWQGYKSSYEEMLNCQQ